MKSYLIHLIRHGASAGNLQGRYIGKTDSPLAMESVKTLAELKQNTNTPLRTLIIAAPTPGAGTTLKILYPGETPLGVDGLEECDFGDWEGKTASELQKTDPAFAKWMAGGEQASPPNGEGARPLCTGCVPLLKSWWRASSAPTHTLPCW